MCDVIGQWLGLHASDKKPDTPRSPITLTFWGIVLCLVGAGLLLGGGWELPDMARSWT